MDPIEKFNLPTASLGEALWLITMHLVGFGATGVAVSNLASDFGAMSKLASAIWLVGFFLLWFFNIKWDGCIQSTGSQILERFATGHFLEIDEGGESLRVLFKYTASGIVFTVFEAKGSGLVELGWQPGQASAMMNEDRNDWYLFLRVKSKDIITYRRRGYEVDKEENLILSEGQTFAEAEALSAGLARFLRNKGVEVSIARPKDDVISKRHERYRMPSGE